jgi:hypothetical protein
VRKLAFAFIGRGLCVPDGLAGRGSAPPTWRAVGARNSHLCRAGVNLPRTEPRGPRHKQATEHLSTACAGSSAQSPPCGVDVRTFSPGSWATGREAGVTNHHSQITIHPQAKKKLIATHANSKIATTYSKHRTSLFLIATRISFSSLRFRQTLDAIGPTPPWFGGSSSLTTGRDPSGEIPFLRQGIKQMLFAPGGSPSGQMLFVSQGKENYLAGFAIVSLGASGVPEVYNPGRFLRRHP